LLTEWTRNKVRVNMNELDFILVKPAGPDCNLNCEYCFYLEKAALFPESPVHRMGEDTLKILIRQSSELNSQQITFGWQGGEPLLMGLPFFKHAVLLQKEFFKGRFVENTFQTNGIFIDRDWGKFFRENHFLLGLSIDGPQEIHDRFRRNGKGSFERVMAAWKILQEENVEVNSVTSVHRESQDCVDEIYSFLKEIGFHWMQFIPIVERDPKSPRSIRSFSVTPKGYGDFLCRLFDHWLKGFHLGKSTTPIRWFESLFFSFVGLEAPECTLKKNCGQYLVVEYNGDVYPCDFFVEPGWKLGNIHQDHLAHLAQSHRRQEFARRKRVADAHCMKCRWLRFCYGGCPKDRFKGQLNYLCPAYSCFFQHAEPTMKKMAGLWKSDNRIG